MEMKDRKKAEETAENRMQMIAPLLAPNLSHADASKLKEEISGQYEVSIRTLERYCKSYLNQGFEGLCPQGRSKECKYKIPRELLDEASRLRRELPSRSIPTIIQILELEGKEDIKYGPVLMLHSVPTQTYFSCLIDDATRYILHAEFYANMEQDIVEDTLHKSIFQYGVPKRLYREYTEKTSQNRKDRKRIRICVCVLRQR